MYHSSHLFIKKKMNVHDCNTIYNYNLNCKAIKCHGRNLCKKKKKIINFHQHKKSQSLF